MTCNSDVGDHVGDGGDEGEGDAVDAQSDGMSDGIELGHLSDDYSGRDESNGCSGDCVGDSDDKMKTDLSFFSGSLQNLSPPRRPSHPYAPKTVPPAGCPGAPGVPCPRLHHPSIWPAAQRPQWEGSIPRTPISPRIAG